MVASRESERVRRFYEEYAADHGPWMCFHDSIMLGDARRKVCSRASGQTLKLAIGTGMNLPYYPDGVRLTGVDLSPAMLAIVKQRSRKLGIDAEFFVGDADALDFLSTWRNRADHLRGPEGGEVPEGALERSLMLQADRNRQPAELA